MITIIVPAAVEVSTPQHRDGVVHYVPQCRGRTVTGPPRVVFPYVVVRGT